MIYEPHNESFLQPWGSMAKGCTDSGVITSILHLNTSVAPALHTTFSKHNTTTFPVAPGRLPPAQKPEPAACPSEAHQPAWGVETSPPPPTYPAHATSCPTELGLTHSKEPCYAPQSNVIVPQCPFQFWVVYNLLGLSM